MSVNREVTYVSVILPIKFREEIIYIIPEKSLSEINATASEQITNQRSKHLN